MSTHLATLLALEALERGPSRVRRYPSVPQADDTQCPDCGDHPSRCDCADMHGARGWCPVDEATGIAKQGPL